jgi:hypothetical protein
LPLTSTTAPTFSPHARPALVTLAAATVRDRLPSRVADAFTRDRPLLTESPVIFDLELHPYLKSAQEAAAIATIVGLFLFAFGLLSRARRHQYRAEAAPDAAQATP